MAVVGMRVTYANERPDRSSMDLDGQQAYHKGSVSGAWQVGVTFDSRSAVVAVGQDRSAVFGPEGDSRPVQLISLSGFTEPTRVSPVRLC